MAAASDGGGRPPLPRRPAARQRFKRDRRTRDPEADEHAKGIEMQEFFSSVVQLDKPAGCTFNLDSATERSELALICWGENNGNLRDAPRLSAENVQLAALFTTLVQS
eukprot:5737975-Pleurochrysis_carterae.AAC.1